MGIYRLAENTRNRLIEEKRRAMIVKEHVEEIEESLKEIVKNLEISLGPRPSLTQFLGKTVALSLVSALVGSTAPMTVLAVRGASLIHTLLTLSRARRMRLGELLYEASTSIRRILECL
ncbi:MAG: hypothetical protein ABWW69_07775 [Pyrodictiaceae archaeon]